MRLDERGLRGATAALALVGAAIAAYLTYTRATDGQYLCTTGGCEVVQSSRYAEVAAVPVAVLGLAGYLLILATAAVSGEVGRAAGVSLALAGFGFSMYLLYVQFAVLGAVCLWCVGSDAVMALLLGVSLLRVRISVTGRTT